MRLIEHLKTDYNDVHVWERADGIDFEVAGGTHATWSAERLMTGYVWDALTAGVLLKPDTPPRRILVLGLGGGTVIRQLRHFLPRARITAVDIDPGMIALARRYMHLDSLDVEIVTGDAYAYAEGTADRYDIVMDDVYLGTAQDVQRPALFDDATFRKLTGCLTPDGLMLANMVTGSGHRAIQQQARSGFLHRFSDVRAIRSAKGFNETLVGAAELAHRDRLREWDHRLTDPRDLQLWQAIRISPLRRR